MCNKYIWPIMAEFDIPLTTMKRLERLQELTTDKEALAIIAVMYERSRGDGFVSDKEYVEGQMEKAYQQEQKLADQRPPV